MGLSFVQKIPAHLPARGCWSNRVTVVEGILLARIGRPPLASCARCNAFLNAYSSAATVALKTTTFQPAIRPRPFTADLSTADGEKPVPTRVRADHAS